jgi:hypothetical protein
MKMIVNIKTFGLLVGVISIIPYVIICLRKKDDPDIKCIGELILSGVGVITSLEFCFKMIFYEDSYLGSLCGDRLTIIIGAVTVLLVSILTIKSVYRDVLLDKAIGQKQ